MRLQATGANGENGARGRERWQPGGKRKNGAKRRTILVERNWNSSDANSREPFYYGYSRRDAVGAHTRRQVGDNKL